MQNPNQFAQFGTAPGGQIPGHQQSRSGDFGRNPGNPQFPQQFPAQQFPNPQMMQFQTMQHPMMGMNPGMNPNMNPGMGPGGPGPMVQPGPGPNAQGNMAPPKKQRLLVRLENNERGFYNTLLMQVDPEDRGKIEGKDAVLFFKRSGLPVDVLKKIWLMSSTDNKFLDKEEFFVALRLVAYAQNNIEVSPQSIIQNISVPLPKFQPAQRKEPPVENIPVPDPSAQGGNVQPNVQGNMPGPMQGNIGGNMPGPMQGNMGGPMQGNMGGPMQGNMGGPMQGNMAGPMQGNLGGNMPGPMGGNMNGPMGGNMGGPMGGNMMNPMMDVSGNMPNNMNMPSMGMPEIKENKMSGQMSDGFGSFGNMNTSVMPGNTSMSMGGNMQSVDLMGGMGDTQIPPPIMNTTTTSIVPGSTQPGTVTAMKMSPDNSMMGGMNQSQISDSQLAQSPQPQAPAYSVDDFVEYPAESLPDFSPEMVAQYEAIYQMNDPTKKGLITQEEAKDIFTKSGLPNEVLYKIWLFSDHGDLGCLDKADFMLAVHLIALSRKKIRLPDQLPAKYEKFVKDQKKKLPDKAFLVEKLRDSQSQMHSMPVQPRSPEYNTSPTLNQEQHYQSPDHNVHYGQPEPHRLDVPQSSDMSGPGMNQIEDQVPLHQGYHESPQRVGGMHDNMLRKAEEHQSQLIAAVSQMQEVNGRAVMEKSEDVSKLNMILQNCQAILKRLVDENQSVQNEIARLDAQKRQITGTIETVQGQIMDEMAKQQQLHQSLKAGAGAPGANMRQSVPANPQVMMSPPHNTMQQNMTSPPRASMGVSPQLGGPSPPKQSGTFDVDFQKEFNGGDWGGFDTNFANQPQGQPANPGGAGNNSLFGGF